VELKQQIQNDLEMLPENALMAISVVVKEFIVLMSKPEAAARPIFGSGKGQIRRTPHALHRSQL
jgi:hypothetical protein